jgi:predicted CoA-binding protein
VETKTFNKEKNMTSRAMINEFMAQKKLALVRASRKTPISGFSIDKELGAKGYAVSVVYLDEDAPGSKLGDLKEPVGGVIIAVPIDQSEKAVCQAIDAKITRIWIQKDSASQEALKLCEQKGIKAIHGECIMMFAEPVKSFHAFHRFLWKLFGKLPK